MKSNDLTRDNHGMYAHGSPGPGPSLMGADTLLGMGDKLFAVPWAALALDTAHKRFTLNVAKATLKDAPGFDKAHWPSMSDQTWAGGVHRFYGTPYVSA
jgi:hypothetical protein